MLTALAEIEISPTGRRLLRDTNAAAHEALEAANTPCKPAGWVRAKVPVESIAVAKGLLLRLGAEVKVRGPNELRDAVAAEADKVADLYRGRRGRKRR